MTIGFQRIVRYPGRHMSAQDRLASALPDITERTRSTDTASQFGRELAVVNTRVLTIKWDPHQEQSRLGEQPRQPRPTSRSRGIAFTGSHSVALNLRMALVGQHSAAARRQ
jgi:hypothetical protein